MGLGIAMELCLRGNVRCEIATKEDFRGFQALDTCLFGLKEIFFYFGDFYAKY